MDSPRLLLTMGDACGIGPEIIIKAFQQDGGAGLCVVGDVELMRRETAGRLPVAQLDSPLQQAPPGSLPVWQPSDLPKGLLELPRGQIDARAGLAGARCIGAAVRAVQQGQAEGIVTAPIHKEALHAAGVPYPGHTEMLQDLASQGGVVRPVRMMLANEELRVVLVTVHCSLRQAIEQVSFESVLQTVRIADAALKRFGIERPRLGVAGLNPHAGEGGLFGSEEIDHIEPAIKAARGDGIDARGPFAPDTVFMRARKGEFDAVIAMTHDQGLIPVKYLGVEQGVNVTLGLPFVRTSPDHGTAFDIAGQGKADANSMLAAIRMARVLSVAG
ncbi:4-hydroxythreonine-4-phosphate dehydrogenase PdxA [Burkholderiaceae bacterium UC74_6]